MLEKSSSHSKADLDFAPGFVKLHGVRYNVLLCDDSQVDLQPGLFCCGFIRS
jgi:hypothetical protein